LRVVVEGLVAKKLIVSIPRTRRGWRDSVDVRCNIDARNNRAKIMIEWLNDQWHANVSLPIIEVITYRRHKFAGNLAKT
jgi:hypothetical protein